MPAPQLEPDRELIRRWQRGERAAFEQLVRLWQPRIGRFLARLTGCSDTAGDLTQEVFLRVYLSASKYRDDGHFATWLFQIAVNLARDAARKSARRPSVPFPDAELPAPDDAAEVRFEKREQADAVTAALAELSPPLREVVLLRHYEEMSFEAMARLLGTPASTLKSRFAVAMMKLRELLTARGLLPEEMR